EAERGALELLLQRLTYLGRAESWCEAALGPSRPSPIRPDGPPLEGAEPRALLALEPGTGLEELEQDTAAIRSAGATRPRGSRWVRYWVPECRGSRALVERPLAHRSRL